MKQMLVLAFLLCQWAVNADQKLVSLRGVALGGNIVITDSINPNPYYVTISTTKGESAEDVLDKISKELTEGYNKRGIPLVARRVGNALVSSNFGAPYILQGTERGLGIPPPMRGLTAYFHDGKLCLNWINPKDTIYDRIFMTGNLRPGPHQNQYSLRQEAFWPNEDLDYHYFIAWGNANEVSSPCNGIFVSRDGTVRDSLAVPYVDGIIPTWQEFQIAGKKTQIQFEQVSRFSNSRPSAEPFKQPDQVPFYQGIRCVGEPTSGIVRPIVIPGLEAKLSFSMRLLVPKGVNASEATISMHSLSLNYGEYHKLCEDRSMRIPAGILNSITEVFSYFPEYKNEGEWVSVGASPESQPILVSKPKNKDMVLIFLLVGGLENEQIGMDWFSIDCQTR